MAYFMTTPLGRGVPVGDWTTYRKDEVLHLLYEFQGIPFNDGTLLFSVAAIVNATRVDLSTATDIARALVADGLAEEPRPGGFRITPKGKELVHAVAAHPLAGVL